MEKKVLYTTETKVYEQTIHKKYRNYKWVLYLSIGGLSLMFLSLTFLYFADRIGSNQANIKMLPVFYWNTIVLLTSSFIVQLTKKYFQQDNFSSYKTSLILLMGCGILFLFGQITGWIALFKSGFHFNHHSAAYLYIISGLHALHIAGGLIFLGIFISKSWKMLSDYAMSVVYFSDPVIESQLHLFGIFWHFLGIMWVYLLFFFMLVR